jgi:hypothetical protein
MTGSVVPTKKAVGLINDDQVKMVRKFFFRQKFEKFYRPNFILHFLSVGAPQHWQ